MSRDPTPPPAAMYRFSEVGLVDGKIQVVVRVYDDPKRLETLLHQGNVVLPAEIAGLVQPLGFAPSDHEAEELALVMNKIRVTKPREAGFDDKPRLENVAKALAVILDDAPTLVEILRGSIRGAGPGAVAYDIRRRIGWAADLEMLIAIAERLRKHRPFVPPGRKTRVAPLQRDAIALGFLFEQLAKKHRKDASFTAQGGLGAEIVRQALARVGITMSASAVARAIERHKDRPMRTIDLGGETGG